MEGGFAQFAFGAVGPADDSEAARNRRVLCGCTFAAACTLLAPGEFRSAAFLFFVALLQWARHRVLLAREAALLAPAAAPDANAGEGPTAGG